MKLPLLFARRYLFSPKSHSVINMISWISMITIAVPVAAMVILLSVFNGFDGMVKQMYKNFDPDILITASQGKTLDKNDQRLANIQSVEGIEQTSIYIEDNALFAYNGKQYIGVLRGVDCNYRNVTPIDSMITAGAYAITQDSTQGITDSTQNTTQNETPDSTQQAVVGQGLAYALGIQLNLIESITVYVPQSKSKISLINTPTYNQATIPPGGIFTLDAETDSRYMLVPYAFAANVLGLPEQITGVMIKAKHDVNIKSLQRKLTQLLGDDFRVLNRYQQKQSYYTIMQYEKWGIYFIVLLVLLIASFSIIGSLVMLIIDKKNDIFTLSSMGANEKFIRNIFISQGLMITTIGTAIGLILGVTVCLLQQHFGFVKLQGESFLVDTYPVDMRFIDFITIVTTVGIVGLVMSWLTVTLSRLKK